jgi:hypothetical protein
MDGPVHVDLEQSDVPAGPKYDPRFHRAGFDLPEIDVPL